MKPNRFFVWFFRVVKKETTYISQTIVGRSKVNGKKKLSPIWIGLLWKGSDYATFFNFSLHDCSLLVLCVFIRWINRNKTPQQQQGEILEHTFIWMHMLCLRVHKHFSVYKKNSKYKPHKNELIIVLHTLDSSIFYIRLSSKFASFFRLISIHFYSVSFFSFSMIRGDIFRRDLWSQCDFIPFLYGRW